MQRLAGRRPAGGCLEFFTKSWSLELGALLKPHGKGYSLMATRTLTLYSTLGCHLCEEALAIISPLLQPLDLELLECDIADSDELVSRYGVRIPVVQLQGACRDLGWPFTGADVAVYVADSTSAAH